MLIYHKFIEHKISTNTEKLILGTFNPNVDGNDADFFYGRKRNYLWSLLSKVFGESSLKGKNLDLKFEFMKRYKIDFIDLIEIVDVEEGQERNYCDEYIDSRVVKWKNILELFSTCKIKEVYFTRKTLNKIPNIKRKIKEIESYCINKGIKFRYLITPARLETVSKLEQWKNAFIK